MGLFGKAVAAIGRRLGRACEIGKNETIRIETIALLDPPTPPASVGEEGVVLSAVWMSRLGCTPLGAASSIESFGMLSPQHDGVDCDGWTRIAEDEKRPQRGGFRVLCAPASVEAVSLESPEDLPDRWRLVLPALHPVPSESGSADACFFDGCRPYPYQWEGIRALVGSDGFILADDMGTGKTVQALLAARLLFQRGLVRTMLVVAPIGVLAQWRREASRWAHLLLVDLVRGTPSERKELWARPAHVKLAAYETLRQDREWLARRSALKFDLIVLDEAQRIKHAGTATAQAVHQVKASRRWGLTGTPLENRVDEVRAIYSYLRPGLLKATLSTPGQMMALLKPHLLRRRKEEVLVELPSKEEFEVWLKMGDAQQRAYDEMEKNWVLELSQKASVTAQSILTLILELKKICNRDPRSGDSIKGEWLRETMDNIAEAGNKALVFSQFRQPQFGGSEWIAVELAKHAPVNYCEAKSDRARERLLQEFSHDPERKVFIGHPKTAGLGLNQLVAANYVIHFDHWWNPATTNQATARAHRPGQNRGVIVYHLWVEGTIEEMIRGKLQKKQALFDETIDSLATPFSKSDLFEVFEELLGKYKAKG
jgi:SNF2 family DNA or RNA helicase